MSLDDIYAFEAAGNDVDEDELLEDFEATEADASNLDDPKLPQLDLNASFAKETQMEHHPEETSEDIVGNPIVSIKEVQVVPSKSKDQLPDVNSDHDISENDDDEDVDVDENSDLSNEESVAKVDRNTAEVRGYEEFSVSENDDESNNEVIEDTLDNEVKNFSVDVEENSKVELEDPNEFIEVKVERNVV